MGGFIYQCFFVEKLISFKFGQSVSVVFGLFVDYSRIVFNDIELIIWLIFFDDYVIQICGVVFKGGKQFLNICRGYFAEYVGIKQSGYLVGIVIVIFYVVIVGLFLGDGKI